MMKQSRFFVAGILLVVGAILASIPAQAGCLSTVTAAVNWGNGKAYFFGYSDESSSLQYVRYDISSDQADAGYPKAVTESTWPGLGFDDIVAAINYGNGKAYFFGYYNDVAAMYYVRYDIAADRADAGYPKVVSDDTWPGLSMLPNITAALDFGDGNVYFFGYNYDYSDVQLGLTYNKDADIVLEDYPEEITEENTGGHLLPDITAAVDWGNRFYLFGWTADYDYQAYERFSLSTGSMDSGYPRYMTSDMWPGLACY